MLQRKETRPSEECVVPEGVQDEGVEFGCEMLLTKQEPSPGVKVSIGGIYWAEDNGISCFHEIRD
jgi:hypothetical protein